MRSFLFLLLLIAPAWQLHAQNQWQIRVMPQVAFGTNNDIQQPNDQSGTRFSLDKDFSRRHGGVFSPRVEVEYNIKRHHIIATGAWLTNRFEGVAPRDIHYAGILFPQGTGVDAEYSFNTYRLGYRYRIVEKQKINFELGATILLRDAFISLEDNSDKGVFSNVGVAPLISYYFEWMATERLSLLSYGDALAVKAGRAEDIFAGAKYSFTPTIEGILGYRLLEGGSDGNRVYTMATFHFISVGVAFRIN